MEDKLKVSIDNEYKIRVFDPAKFNRSEELQKECGNFAESKKMH